MKARIPQADHMALRAISKAQHVSMSELARQAIRRIFNGELDVPARLPAEKDTTFVVDHRDEELLKPYAQQKNTSVDEVIRYAIHDLVENMKRAGNPNLT